MPRTKRQDDDSIGAQGRTLLQHGVGADRRCTSSVSMAIPRMAVLGVVPREERPAEGLAAWISPNAEPGWYFRVLNWASEKGLPSLTWGRLSASHPEVGPVARCMPAGHGRPAVGVQGEDLGLDALLEAGLLDISVAARAAFSRSATIQDHVAAEDFARHPACRSEQSSDVPRPRLVRPGGHQLGQRCSEDVRLMIRSRIVPADSRPGCSIHRALRAQVLGRLHRAAWRRPRRARGRRSEGRRAR